MTISWFQAALLGLFACLSSMPGLGAVPTIGNYYAWSSSLSVALSVDLFLAMLKQESFVVLLCSWFTLPL